MQPNQGPAPSSFIPHPSSTDLQIDKFLERWWVAIPGQLRRYSVYLSETWADGIYLTAWPKVAAFAPLVLLFGLLEGISHWSLMINDPVPVVGEVPLAFTQLLPLMVLTAAISALSANLGLVLVLGYALGDFLIAGFRFTYAEGFRNFSLFPTSSTIDPTQSFFYLHLAQLISYVLFLLLVFPPTLSSKYLVPRMDWFTEPTLTLVRTGTQMLIQGAIVYAWTLSAPLLIRVFWAWTNDQPPLSAASYLQLQGGWVVTAAVVGVAVREWLTHLARRNPVATQRIERQASALRTADTRPAFSRSLPSYVRSILAAGMLTLLISGFIPSLLWGIGIFVFLALILVARTTLLPALPFWEKWIGLTARIPVVARIAVGAFLSFVVTQVIISLYQNQQLTPGFNASETFLPVLIGVSISLLIMTVLIPPISQVGVTPPPARPPSPPFYGPPPSPPAMWPAGPAQPVLPVQPPPMWQAPPNQPPPPMWQVPPNQPPPPPMWQVPPNQTPPPIPPA